MDFHLAVRAAALAVFAVIAQPALAQDTGAHDTGGRAGASGPRFDKPQADIQGVTLRQDERAEIMLRSWGNTILQLEALQCYTDGFLTGIAREGNGVWLASFARRKEVLTAGSHPAALWP